MNEKFGVNGNTIIFNSKNVVPSVPLQQIYNLKNDILNIKIWNISEKILINNL